MPSSRTVVDALRDWSLKLSLDFLQASVLSQVLVLGTFAVGRFAGAPDLWLT